MSEQNPEQNPTEMAREIGKRLRTLREARGWSRGRLETITGIDKMSLYRYETGRTLPVLGRLLALIELLGGSPSSVLQRLPGVEKITAPKPDGRAFIAHARRFAQGR